MRYSANEETLNTYEQRINRVIDYIVKHIDQELSLEVLADVACFSKFHFHRVFRALVGETLNDFIRRLRLEKAAYLLVFNRRKSITEIAFDCGFSSSQNFAKAFKRQFDITPSQLRKTKDFRQFQTLQSKIGNMESNLQHMESNPGEDIGHLFTYYRHRRLQDAQFVALQQTQRNAMKVEVQEVPVMTVAYIRHIGPYHPKYIGPIFQELITWAEPRGLLHEQATVIGVSWDTPNITPESKCRYDACVTVPKDFEPDRRVSVQQLPGGRYARYQCEVVDNQFQAPWIALMRDWLPFSGYQPDDRPTYEIFRNTVYGHPEGSWVIDFCLPVKPL